MSLISDPAQKTLDYAFQGQPAVEIAAKQTFPATGTLDYAIQGQPFVVSSEPRGAQGRPRIFVCT